MTKPSADNQDHVRFNDALTLTGFGKFNVFLLLATGGCICSVILETTGMMFVSPAAECDLKLTLSTKGYLASASFLGVVAGSHFWGFIADTRGRKKAIVISMTGSFVITLMSSITPWNWLFIILRFLNGLFISAASSITYVYCGEFHDDRWRPKMVSGIATFVGIGNVMLSGLAWLILPYEWAYDMPYVLMLFRPWKLLVIVYGFPSILFTAFILMLPESPKYLLTQGRPTEALNILKTMYKINTGNAKHTFPVSNLVWKGENNSAKLQGGNFLKDMWDQTVCLVSRPLALKTFMVCTLQFGAFGITSGIIMWYPEILNQMTRYEKEHPNHATTFCSAIQYSNVHLSTPTNESLVQQHLCSDFIHTEVFFVFIIVAMFLVITYTLIGFLINVIGKKTILIGLFIISMTNGLLAQYVSGSNVLKMLLGLALISTTSIGVINAVVVDLYPTKIRAMALAISLMLGRTGAFIASHITGWIFYHLCNNTFHIYAGLNIVLILLVIFLRTSTPTPKIFETVT